MLTIGAIVRWEALVGKSFFAADYSSEDELLAFVYALNPSQGVPFSTWLTTDFSRTSLEASLGRLTASLQLWEQYLTRGEEKPTEGDCAPEGGNIPTVTDLVADLVVSGGVSAKWAFEDMTLLELQAMQRALERRQHYELENARLWTFFSVVPHLAGNKIKSPSDLLPFPWESSGAVSNWTDEERAARIKQLREE